LNNLIKVGKFKIESGSVIVSDPCYDTNLWCCNQLDSIKEGNWIGCVIREKVRYGWGIRNVRLLAVHEDYENKLDNGELQFELTGIQVGVDSGQAGIFDLLSYRKNKLIDYTPNPGFDTEPWYGACAEKTLKTEISAGIVPNGVVSESGIGDGSYDLYIAQDYYGLIIAIKIDFVGYDENGNDKLERE
jgi:hypothetical protein